MCGIAGFSLAVGSKVNARALANALLSEAEVRGTDASGFGYATRDGRRGLHKDAVLGSQLTLKGLPRDADSVILHTRMATHGTFRVNANNHPVQTSSGRIMLAHNGVVYNHDEARMLLPKEVHEALPEVDTSVIPAMLEEYGVEGFDLLAGDAAAGWLDTETSNTLHLARMSHSPVSIVRLVDGSVVWASTEAILGKALVRAGLQWVGQTYPNLFPTLAEGTYLQITDGEIVTMPNVGWYHEYWNFRSYTTNTDYRAITSGKAKASEDKWAEAWALEDDDFQSGWWDESGIFHGPDERPDEGEPYVLADWDTGVGPGHHDQFYVIDHEGDYQGFASLNTLVQSLRWHAALSSETNLAAEGQERWVNHFADVGTVEEDGTTLSWLVSPDAIEEFDAFIEGGLGFIRDGVQTLRHVLA